MQGVTGKWLAGVGGMFYGPYAFRKAAEYQAAFRLRLLLPVASYGVAQRGAGLVPSGETLDPDDHLLRFLHDGGIVGRAWKTRRHDVVRDTLVRFIRDNIGATHTIESETRVWPVMVAAEATAATAGMGAGSDPPVLHKVGGRGTYARTSRWSQTSCGST